MSSILVPSLALGLLASVGSAVALASGEGTAPVGVARVTGATRTTVTATIVDGRVRLSSDTIELQRGGTVTVELQDTDSHYLFAVLVPRDGSTPRPWIRDRAARGSRHTFKNVKDEIDSIVFAVPKAEKEGDPPKYGPVLKVKPKGG